MNKHDLAEEAIALRLCAKDYDPDRYKSDAEARKAWRELSRKSLEYARAVLAGQCIPPVTK